jgi:hypothetical protein
MRQHGKKSAAAVVAQMAVVDGGFGSRAEPPAGMPEVQAAIWRETVKGEPADFFNTATLRGLLQEYCRHKAVADEMSILIDEFDPTWLAEPKGMRRYEWLLKVRRVESKAASDIATKLRLTNLSRMRSRAAEPKIEIEGGEDDPWMKGLHRA